MRADFCQAAMRNGAAIGAAIQDVIAFHTWVGVGSSRVRVRQVKSACDRKEIPWRACGFSGKQGWSPVVAEKKEVSVVIIQWESAGGQQF